MKTINTIFISALLLLIIVGACANEDSTGTVYQIKKHEILLLPNLENIEKNTSDFMYAYIDDTTGDKEYWISFKGYFMQGLSGKVHNIPDNIKKMEIPDTGIKISISGQAKKSDYPNIPEILPIDFYCTSIEIIDKLNQPL